MGGGERRGQRRRGAAAAPRRSGPGVEEGARPRSAARRGSPPPRGSPGAGCCAAGASGRTWRGRRHRPGNRAAASASSAARRSDGDPMTSSISSGANSTTRSGRPRALGRRPTPLTRIRLRPPRPVGTRARTIATSRTSRADAAFDAGEVVGPSGSARRRRVVRCERPQPSSAIASSRLVLPAAFGPQTSCGPGPERGLERRVPAQVERRSRRVERRRRRSPGVVGRRPDGHDDVDVLVVADRLEHAGRQRPVELERELVGVDVGQDVREVAGVERDRRRRRPRPPPRPGRRGRRPRRWR